MKKWIIRFLLGFIGIMMILAIVGFVYQSMATANDARSFPLPGEMIDVGGYRFT